MSKHTLMAVGRNSTLPPRPPTRIGARVVLNSQHVRTSGRCGLGQSALRGFRTPTRDVMFRRILTINPPLDLVGTRSTASPSFGQETGDAGGTRPCQVEGFKARTWVGKIFTLLAIATSLAANDGFAVSSIARDATAQFDAANKLYEEGKFTDAVAAYESIRQTGVASPALYFNLGNARFKSAQIGRALVAYRQAEQLAPRDPDVRANLQFTRNQVQGPTRHAGRLERWLGSLSLNEWTALTVVSLWLTFVSLAAIQLKPKLAPSLRNFTYAATAATLIFGAALALAFTTRGGANSAIVIARDVTVHNGPFDESPSAFTVHDGAELRVLDRKDNWLQVTDENRRTGWLKRNEVELLKSS